MSYLGFCKGFLTMSFKYKTIRSIDIIKTWCPSNPRLNIEGQPTNLVITTHNSQNKSCANTYEHKCSISCDFVLIYSAFVHILVH